MLLFLQWRGNLNCVNNEKKNLSGKVLSSMFWMIGKVLSSMFSCLRHNHMVVLGSYREVRDGGRG